MKNTSKFPVSSGWKLLLIDMGINPSDVLQLANLPKDLFTRGEVGLSSQEYFRFWQGLDKLDKTQELPLIFAEAFSVESFSPPIFASLCSPDFNVALKRLRKFKPLIAPMRLELDINEQTTSVSIHCEKCESPLPRSMILMELIFFTQLFRLATRKRIIPLEITSPTNVPSPEKYREYFGVSVKEADVMKLTFRAKDAKEPFLTENAGIWDFFEPELQQRLSKLEEHTSTRQRVKSALLELLPSGQVSIDSVASQLAMSKRTLQRKLGAEEIKYQKILNDTRQELAEYYLSNSTTSPSEISFLLGFNETTSFYRAFSSWTGTTPETFREQHYHP